MDRRDFLKTAGGTGLGLWALAGASVATAAHHEAGEDS